MLPKQNNEKAKKRLPQMDRFRFDTKDISNKVDR